MSNSFLKQFGTDLTDSEDVRVMGYGHVKTKAGLTDSNCETTETNQID